MYFKSMGASDAGGYNRLCVCLEQACDQERKKNGFTEQLSTATVVAGILVVVPIYGRPNLVDP